MKYLAIFDHHNAISGLQDVSDWTEEEIDKQLDYHKDFGTKSAVVESLPELRTKMTQFKAH